MIEPGDYPANAQLEEGAFIESAVTVFSYMIPDGSMRYGVYHAGDRPLSNFIGLLELGKINLYERAQEEWQ